MTLLLPPRGWGRDGLPLPLFLSVPSEDGETRERHELLWPPEAPLPRVGDYLTRRTYKSTDRHPGGLRAVTLSHLVLSFTWETLPGHGSPTHPMLSALVVVLGDGYEE